MAHAVRKNGLTFPNEVCTIYFNAVQLKKTQIFKNALYANEVVYYFPWKGNSVPPGKRNIDLFQPYNNSLKTQLPKRWWQKNN